MELLLGCGRSKGRRINPFGGGSDQWTKVVTADWNADVRPDIVMNLEKLPYPFKSDSFDEIHAYEVLEHTGQQGDWRFFFDQFTELWRILKPGGFLCGTCPGYLSQWAWGDPSHTRVITAGTLTFLSQRAYKEECDTGATTRSDFRFYYKADFETVWIENSTQNLSFILKAVKETKDGQAC